MTAAPLRIAIPLLIAVFAAGWCLHVGRLGLFPLDQSIVFDGAYRVASGQMPVRDFVSPYGLTAFWMHGAVFTVFGVSYFVFVAGAAAINALAALLVYAILRRLFAESLWPAACGALLTAIWFYPQYGTPSGEHTAFFFCLLALWLAVESLVTNGGRRAAYAALAGVAVVLAFLGKQNAAMFFAPLVPGVFVAGVRDGWRGAVARCAWAALGAAAAAGALSAWLAVHGTAGEFLRYYVEVPAQIGQERMLKLFYRPYETLLRIPLPMSVRVVLSGALLAALLGFLGVWLRRRAASAQLRWSLVGLIVAAGGVVVQNAFIATTFNHPTDGFVLAGVIVAIGGGLLWRACGEGSWRVRGVPALRVASVALMAMATVVIGKEGVNTARQRLMHDVFADSSFDVGVSVERLEYLRWATPTTIKGGTITAADLERLHAYLARRGPFFVFPEFTLLYGILGVPSPQPLLWFHPGLTYPRGGDAGLDRRIVESLDAHGVDTVVIQRHSWFGTDRVMRDFPHLRRWLESRFRRTGSIGVFDLHERTEAQPEKSSKQKSEIKTSKSGNPILSRQ